MELHLSWRHDRRKLGYVVGVLSTSAVTLATEVRQYTHHVRSFTILRFSSCWEECGDSEVENLTGSVPRRRAAWSGGSSMIVSE